MTHRPTELVEDPRGKGRVVFAIAGHLDLEAEDIQALTYFHHPNPRGGPGPVAPHLSVQWLPCGLRGGDERAL